MLSKMPFSISGTPCAFLRQFPGILEFDHNDDVSIAHDNITGPTALPSNAIAVPSTAAVRLMQSSNTGHRQFPCKYSQPDRAREFGPALPRIPLHQLFCAAYNRPTLFCGVGLCER